MANPKAFRSKVARIVATETPSRKVQFVRDFGLFLAFFAFVLIWSTKNGPFELNFCVSRDFWQRIPNLQEFFLYVPCEFMGLSFKLTNGRASFTQLAISNTLSETLSGCDWLIVCN